MDGKHLIDMIKKNRKLLIFSGSIFILAVIFIAVKSGLSMTRTNENEKNYVTEETVSEAETTETALSTEEDISKSTPDVTEPATAETPDDASDSEAASDAEAAPDPDDASDIVPDADVALDPDADIVPNADPTPEGTPEPVASMPNRLEINFLFNYAYPYASDQYAIWIEDASGNLVKTIFVTNFTTLGSGYTFRGDTLPLWVSKADPGTMSTEQMDAISGATPQGGEMAYSWDLTDGNGNLVPEGTYTLYLEGTLYWSSIVRYSGSFAVGGGEIEDIDITSSFTAADTTNRDMIENVRASLLFR